MQHKYKQLIPVLVLIVCCLWTISTALQGGVDLSGNQYGAFVVLTITVICFFIARPFYKYLLVLTLGLGLFNLINFIPAEVKTGFGIGSLMVYFSPVVFVVVLLTYFLNRNQANKVLFALIGPSPERAEKNRKAQQAEEINKFKTRYAKYADSELETILQEKKYVPEALQAAREILRNRNTV